MGKHHASSSEDESDGAPSGDEAAGAEADPFFAPEEDPFSDPFFQARCLLEVSRRACASRALSVCMTRFNGHFPAERELVTDERG